MCCYVVTIVLVWYTWWLLGGCCGVPDACLGILGGCIAFVIVSLVECFYVVAMVLEVIARAL